MAFGAAFDGDGGWERSSDDDLGDEDVYTVTDSRGAIFGAFNMNGSPVQSGYL